MSQCCVSDGITAATSRPAAPARTRQAASQAGARRCASWGWPSGEGDAGLASSSPGGRRVRHLLDSNVKANGRLWSGPDRDLLGRPPTGHAPAPPSGRFWSVRVNQRISRPSRMTAFKIKNVFYSGQQVSEQRLRSSVFPAALWRRVQGGQGRKLGKKEARNWLPGTGRAGRYGAMKAMQERALGATYDQTTRDLIHDSIEPSDDTNVPCKAGNLTLLLPGDV